MTFVAPDIFLGSIKAGLEQVKEHRRRTGRPFCTLSYAQSLDGCIAANPMHHMVLSGRKSQVFTHHLRSWHDAILVGIRTVLADNPGLNVRLVTGRDPQPVVLDSRLRTPLDSNLLNHGNRRPWIATGEKSDPARQNPLEARGARVIRFPTDRRGWVSLEPVLDRMGQMGVSSLMVEGGARVLTSFMEARLVDQVIVTVSPLILGGVRSYFPRGRNQTFLTRLQNVRYADFGQDLMVWGRPFWKEK